MSNLDAAALAICALVYGVLTQSIIQCGKLLFHKLCEWRIDSEKARDQVQIDAELVALNSLKGKPESRD